MGRTKEEGWQDCTRSQNRYPNNSFWPCRLLSCDSISTTNQFTCRFVLGNLQQFQLNCTLLNNNKNIIDVKCTHVQGKAKYLCARSHHHRESGPPKQSTGESIWLIFFPWQENLFSTGPCFPAIPRVLLATGQAGAWPDIGEKKCREGVGPFMPFFPDLYSKLLPKVTKLKDLVAFD